MCSCALRTAKQTHRQEEAQEAQEAQEEVQEVQEVRRRWQRQRQQHGRSMGEARRQVSGANHAGTKQAHPPSPVL